MKAVQVEQFVSAENKNTSKARLSLIDCWFEFQVCGYFITLSRLSKTAGDCDASFNQAGPSISLSKDKFIGPHIKHTSIYCPLIVD